jgi:hypothetical protein
MTDVLAGIKQLVKLVASKNVLAVHAFTEAVPSECTWPLRLAPPQFLCSSLVRTELMVSGGVCSEEEGGERTAGRLLHAAGSGLHCGQPPHPPPPSGSGS